MKKGLTFALLMVAMVALATSASAVAPTISDLPAIIVGDVNDISGSGTPALHLLRYTNIVNLADQNVINTHGASSASLKVWYLFTDTNPTALKVSTPSTLVDVSTAADLAALQATGTEPAAAKTINLAKGFWFSLIQDAPAGASHATSAASATAAANGNTTTGLNAAGALNTKYVKLFATAADSATTLAGVQTNPFPVYSVLGVDDSYSPPAVIVFNEVFTNGAGTNWTSLTYGGTIGTFQDPTAAQFINQAGGIGYTGAATFSTGKTGMFGTWRANNLSQAPANNMAGNLFRTRVLLSGNGATAAACPGYRVLYLTQSFTHMGGFQVFTPAAAGSTAANAPATGAPVEVRAVWAVPTDLSEFSDTGAMNKGIDATRDYRDYFFQFDVVQLDAGDNGSLVMNQLEIAKVLRPNSVTPFIKYGTAADATKAFNAAAASGGWQIAGGDGGTGWGAGTATVNAGSMQLAVAGGTATTGGAFRQVAPFPDAVNSANWATNKLIRITYNAASSDPALAATLRFFVISWMGPAFGSLGSVIWADIVDPSGLRPVWAKGTHTALPAAPKSGGSTLEFYVYTGKGPSGSESGVLGLDMDMAQAPGTYPQNGWAKPTGTMTISSCAVEVLP